MTDELGFLETWYRAQCNGYWEHAYGMTIETLDTPGWLVTIDLAETPLEDRSMEPLRQENSDKDWLVCTVERKRFRGQGDSAKLTAILEVFRHWVSSNTPALVNAADRKTVDPVDRG